MKNCKGANVKGTISLDRHQLYLFMGAYLDDSASIEGQLWKGLSRYMAAHAEGLVTLEEVVDVASRWGSCAALGEMATEFAENFMDEDTPDMQNYFEEWLSKAMEGGAEQPATTT